MSEAIRCDVCKAVASINEARLGDWMIVSRPSSSISIWSSRAVRDLHVCGWPCLGMLALTPVDFEEETA